jgi:aryl-alcohol dehydrogenase-like predicted oxidoreductase
LDGIELGIGTWAWGDRLFWGYGKGYNDNDLQAAFRAAVEGGVRLFDTAEIYGQGHSETLLGKFIREYVEETQSEAGGTAGIKIATKFMPYPWRLHRGSLTGALKKSLTRLGIARVDLYQIHMPLPPVNVETWMGGMIDAYQLGLISAAGVSNYDRGMTQRAFDTLARQGIQLASNQVEYNLLDRKIEKNGLLKHCQDLGVALIAYSPLGLGLLTGKYTPDNPPSGARGGRTSRNRLAQIQPLIHILRRMGADHAGKSAAQVAINWVIQKGAIPIPGVKNVDQAIQNTGSMGWALSADEVAELDEMSDRVAVD